MIPALAAGAWLLFSIAAQDKPMIALSLSLFCICLWATSSLPDYWPALLFFCVGSICAVAPPATLFSGFYSSGFWLFFSGLAFGAAIRETGLGDRAAAVLARMIGTRYSGVVAGVVFFGIALSFVMPSSMGRIALMVPMVTALADRLGYEEGAQGRVGLLVAAIFGAWTAGFAILPSNLPNMMLAGMSETLAGERIGYGRYLLMHFPVLGLAKGGVLILLILRLFPADAPKPIKDLSLASERGAAKMSGRERRLALLLVGCLLLWSTDGVHGVAPGWVGLAAALYCLLPTSGLTGADAFRKEIAFGPLLFVAGVIGIGATLAATGLGAQIVAQLGAWAAPGPDGSILNAWALAGLSTIVALLVNLASVPAVMTPMASDLAATTGLSVGLVLMTQALAYSNPLLPYHAPPLLAGAQLAQLPVRAILKLCLTMFAIGLLALTPLELLWWRLIGAL